MFTGLVEDLGHIESFHRGADGARLVVASNLISPTVKTGDSVAVNGCCLTVLKHDHRRMSFHLLDESLQRTNLRNLTSGSIVNLERALKADGRLGGHFVQGHVDTTVQVKEVEQSGHDLRIDLEMPTAFAPYIAFKGSVALNGTSLTVAAISPETFSVWIIPHTAAATNLGKLTAGDDVNLECDILAKYAERILSVPQNNAR